MILEIIFIVLFFFPCIYFKFNSSDNKQLRPQTATARKKVSCTEYAMNVF